MHDIDRIRLETQSETGMFEAGPFEAAQFEFAQAETPYGETGEVFGETEQMELASEFLEITSEAELDRFLGGLIERAGRTIGKFVSSPEGRAIGGILKGAAKQVLPGIGSAVGGYFGGATGAKLGRDAASAAGRAFGLELEGLSSEDREFEVARRYVSFAGEAVKNLASTPSGLDPRAEQFEMEASALSVATAAAQQAQAFAKAKSAAVAAAKTHAPGLLSPRQAGMEPQSYSPFPAGHSGRWMRRGNKIVLYGI